MYNPKGVPKDHLLLDEDRLRQQMRVQRARSFELALGASAVLRQSAETARANINDFCEFTLRDSSGAQLKQAVVHRVWHLHTEYCWSKGLIPAILAPYAHGKTSQLTIGRVAFEIGHDVNIRTKIVCQNDSKAMERTMGISALLASPRYRFLFPEVREVPKEKQVKQRTPAKFTQHEFYIDRPGFSIDPTVQAAGVLSSGTGGRADLMIFDDIVDQRNAIDEPALREKVVENVDNVWMQRLEAVGRCLFVGTTWHQADFTHRILERPGWCVLRQFISEDFKRIEQEVYNAPEDYPIARATRETQTLIEVTPVHGSSNVKEISYEPRTNTLEVTFSTGIRYRYLNVPRDVHDAFAAATSKGSFFHQVIRGRYRVAKVPTAKTREAVAV